jgi:hypothetical protein
MKLASRDDAERFLRTIQMGGEFHFKLSSAPSWLEYLQLLVNETATWCSLRADRSAAGACLRPESIRPSVLLRTRWDCVGDVCGKRRTELQRQKVLPTAGHAGRLLLYFPDANLADGAAEAESGGFFDVDNAPPHGTWIAYFEERAADVSYKSYLLSWVPAAPVSLANAGVNVNPEECIAWVDTSDMAIRRVLEFGGVHF